MLPKLPQPGDIEVFHPDKSRRKRKYTEIST